MLDLRKLTSELTVAPQIQPGDVAELALLGFRSLICNRPDNEADASQDSTAMATAAEAAGLSFRYIPFSNGHLSPQIADDFAAALKQMPKPIMAYCRSGTRSAVLWALAEWDDAQAAEIIQAGSDAGYDLSGIGSVKAALAQM